MKKYNAKKLLIFAIISSIILVLMQQTGSISTSKGNSNIFGEEIELNEATNKRTDETEYYAVIAACTNYDNPNMNIPKGRFPIPERKLKKIYDALIEAENWDEENIIILLNKDATKQNIIDAIGEMSNIVDENDYFIFSWQGHGVDVNDIDGDEKINDQSDKYDEAIFPYDTDNYITDDELGENFSKIKAKGMCLIFESCLSGSLINRSNGNKNIQSFESNEIESYNKDFKRDIEDPKIGPLDIDGGNRVIILSTHPNTIGKATFLTGFPMTRALAFAFKGFALDKDKDGFISAEEAFGLAKPLTKIQSSMYDLGIWLYEVLLLKFSGSSNPVLKGTLIYLFAKIFSVFFIYWLTGSICLNWPNMHDTYNGDLPLVKI